MPSKLFYNYDTILDKADDNEFLLVEQKDNWADEMDVEGWWVSSVGTFKAYLAAAQACTHWPKSWYVGSNEGIEYTSADNYIQTLRWHFISNETVEVLDHIFGSDGGRTWDFECYDCEALEEKED